MTVIVTMAGMGSRFRQAGYTVPKYRINARGIPLLQWSLRSLQAFTEEYFVFACLETEDLDWITGTIRDFGISRFIVTPRSGLSRGQAETAFDTLEHVDPADSLWIYNIDTYIVPMAMRPEHLDQAAGCLHVTHSDEPNMSFVRYGVADDVVEVAEKRMISTWATVGMYGFRSAALFHKLYRDAYVDSQVPTVNGEQYVAPMYELLLREGERVIAPRLATTDVHVLGTPAQVLTFDPQALPPDGTPPN